MKRILPVTIILGLALAFSTPGLAAAVVSAKAVGLSQKAASTRVAHKLDRRINRWAHKSKLTTVRVGRAHTTCTKGTAGLYTCRSAARVAA
jgi:hypothetical protein